jgi:hypothetical protein
MSGFDQGGVRVWVLGFGKEIIEALGNMVQVVILNAVKDLKPLKIRDSSLRSELQISATLNFTNGS